MRLESQWKVTFNPDGVARVILDFGNLIDSELAFTLRKALQITPLDEAPAPFLRHAGNASVNLSVRVYLDEAVSADLMDQTARRKMMESLVAVQALEVAPLRVQIKGITTAYWEFDQSYITEYTPVKDSEWEGRVLGYNITAAEVYQVDL